MSERTGELKKMLEYILKLQEDHPMPPDTDGIEQAVQYMFASITDLAPILQFTKQALVALIDKLEVDNL